MSKLEDRLRASFRKYAQEADRKLDPEIPLIRSGRGRLTPFAAAAIVSIGFVSTVVAAGLWIANRRASEPLRLPAAGPSLSPSLSCADKTTVRADVDGDGLEDLVYHQVVQGKVEVARLGVCTASGRIDEIAGIGMSEVLLVGDVEPNGRDEIFFGATSIAAAHVRVAVFIEDGLVEVQRDEGGLFELASGSTELGNSLAWGCEDTDGNGEREVVQVTVKRDGEALRWTREVYSLQAARVTLVSTEAGTMSEPQGGSAGTAASLTSPCEVREGT